MCSREKYLKIMQEEEEKELLDNKDLINSFKSLKVIKEIKNIHFRFIQSIGIVAIYPEIVKLLNSNIEQDKEGLVSCDLLNKYFFKDKFASGIMKSENYMIMSHPLFRRNYNEFSNFSPHFISLFWRLNHSNIDAYIAIDFNRVRIDIDGGYYTEHDTWFGSPFNQKIEHISDGVTKLKPPIIDKADSLLFSIIDDLFNNVYSLDIMWYTTKDKIKVFQAEEFKNSSIIIEVNGIIYYPVRYIHAEFDIKSGYFRHFDGAVQLYTKKEYKLRKDKNFNHKTKGKEQIKPNSIKLFKMNGEISINIWIKFISHFFSGNPLVMEYFSGKYPKHVRDTIVKLKGIKI